MNLPVRPFTPARVQSDLAALNAIGRDPVSDILARTPGSVAEIAALEWLRRRIAAAQSDYFIDEQGFATSASDDNTAAVVIAGDLRAAAGAGPFDGALGIVAGLEVLRCLPAPVTGVALATRSAPVKRASCVFHCAALCGSMLPDSGREVGVALAETAPFTMRRVCEVGEHAGIPVLPLPLGTAGMPATDGPSVVLVVDAALNRWPPAVGGWAAVTACTGLLLNLVGELAALQ